MAHVKGCLKWHGGKGHIADQIVALFPRHRHYVEAYAGGASVLLARDPGDRTLWMPDETGVSEVLNDRNRLLVNFWTALQYTKIFEEMKRRLDVVPFCRWDYDDAVEFLEQTPLEVACSINHAVAFFISVRQSMAGRQKNFTPLTRSRLRGGVNGNASEWLGAIEGLPAVHNRLRAVVIENLPAVDLIEREDTPDTLFYLDPPYLHETRKTTSEYGEFEMSHDDHQVLLHKLATIEGKFLLSGYPSDLYDEATWRNGWHRTDIQVANSAAGGKTKRVMTECVWSNFKPAPRSASGLF